MIVLRWLLSLVFIVQMYLAMAVMAVVFAPWALFSREGALFAAHSYCRWVRFTARMMCGLRSEVRGHPAHRRGGGRRQASKLFDIIMIYRQPAAPALHHEAGTDLRALPGAICAAHRLHPG
jgi:1-acyl-sn-glycerol-3-phosphate acyltransferase